MKSLSLKNKIDFTFTLVSISFCILIYSTYNRANTVSKNRKVISETYNTNTVLEKILSSTIDIETGARGYTITGQQGFLNVYNSGNANLRVWLDSLEEMKGDDTLETAHILELNRLISAKQDFTAKVIHTRNKEGMEGAAKLISTAQGKNIMDSIRIKIGNYQKSQLEILTAKLAETDQNIKARNLNFMLFVVVTFLIVIFAYTKIRKNAKQIVQDGIIQAKLSDELTFQNQQLNDFANQASHNLRSSAANMSSLIDIIEDKSSMDDYRMVFELLKKISNNLNQSLNELIEILRIKKNRTIDKESINFNDIYVRVSETLQGDILKANARIEVDFSKAAHVMFSKIYLESIMQNLISNAIKYRSPDRDPVLQVYSEDQNGYILLHVKDNGLGIDLARHGHKIFGMYQMFHKHPEAKGIGLFITKSQVENLGGKITVSSDGHSGTAFNVRFPK